MAIATIGGVKHFTGLSTDTKPSDSSIGAGSTFVETDNGIIYRYDGDSWLVDESKGDYLLDVARGKVTGSQPFSAYGERTTAVQLTNGVIWPNGEWFAPPSAGVQVSVVSTETTDTTGGTGVRVVRLIMLDADLNEITEDITMNGTTAVLSTATNIRFIQCAFATEFGSTKGADGNISISNIAETENYSYIEAGALRCSSSARMVPAGKRVLVKSIVGSSTSGTSAVGTNIKIALSNFEGVDFLDDNVLIPLANLGYQDNSFGLTLDFPLPVYEGTVIGMLASTDKNSAATVAGSWFGVIEDV